MTIYQKIIVILCAFVAMAIPPGIVVFIVLSHNPQDEYMDAAGQINWESLSFVIWPSVVVGIIAAGIVALVVIFLMKLMIQRKAGGASKDR